MPEPIQFPRGLCFADNIPDLIVPGGRTYIISLTAAGESSPLLQETYWPDSAGIIRLDLRTLVTSRLRPSLPPSGTIAARMDGWTASFTLAGNASSEADSFHTTFTVVGPGIGIAATTEFLSGHFLTLCPPERPADPDTPCLLGYYAQEDALFHLRVAFADGSAETLAEPITADAAWAMNVTFRELSSRFGKEVESLSASIRTSFRPLTSVITWHRRTHDTTGEYIFSNGLGGLDTIAFRGEFSRADKIAATLGLLGGLLTETLPEHTETLSQNTGYLFPSAEILVREFLLSPARWHLHGGVFRRIVMEEGKTEFTRHTPNSCTFEFRYEKPDRTISLPVAPAPDQVLPPFPGRLLWCFDRCRGGKVHDRLGSSATLAVGEETVDCSSAVTGILRKNNTTFWLPDMPGAAAGPVWQKEEFSGPRLVEYATETTTRRLFFRDIRGTDFSSVLPVLVYRDDLSDAEIAEVLRYLEEYTFLHADDGSLLTDTGPEEEKTVFFIDNP